MASFPNSFVLTVQAAATGLFTNTATITAPGANDTSPINNSSSASVNVTLPQVDLGIDKTASAFDLAVGDVFTYTADVNNAGPSTPTGVKVVDTLPAGITFVSLAIRPDLVPIVSCVTPPVGSSGTITCTVNAPLPIGFADNVAVATVRAGAPGLWTNTATISAPGFTETFPGDNSSSASVNVAPLPSPANTFVDLALTKTASSYKVKKGKKFDFEITVRNLGPATAPVQVSDRLSSKVTFRYIDFGDGPVGDCDTPDWGTSGTLSCTFPPLAPGEVIEFEVKVKAKSKGTATNHATASPIAPAGDPNLNNNDAQANVKIR